MAQAGRKKASLGRRLRSAAKEFAIFMNPEAEQQKRDKRLRDIARRKGGSVSVEAHEGGTTRRTTATPRAYGPPRITRETKKGD